MLRQVSALVLAVSGTLLVSVPPGQAGVPASCDGVAATIVDPTAGPDVLTGTPGRDVIVAHGGDTVHARGGNDLVCVHTDGAGHAHVFLEAGADTARVMGAGRATVHGGDGNDVISSTSVTAPGGISLNGGSGLDRLRTSVGPAGLSGGSGNDILRGGPGGDYLAGDEGADQLLAGGEGKDVVVGGPGDDRVTAGGAITDSVRLGRGDDVLTGSNAHLQYNYGATEFDAVVVNLALGRATGQGTDRVSGVVAVSGSRSDDRLLGSYRDERFIGAAGNDTIEAGGGADAIFPQGGHDTVLAGPGADTGFFLGDQVWLGPGDDKVTAGARAHVRGGYGNDQIALDRPVDVVVSAGPGVDTLLFDIGFAWPESVGATVNLTTGHGNVGVWLFDVFDIENVTGTKFADTLIGDDGPNVLTGLGENDTIDGQDGVDTADGGEGTDTCAAETTLNCE